MPSLRYTDPETGRSRIRPLFKRITTLGQSEACDVVLPREPSVAKSHAQILFDGDRFSISSLERNAHVYVNGKKRSRMVLEHEDEIRIGSTVMTFLLYDDEEEPLEPKPDLDVLAAYEKLFQFSRRLMGRYDLPDLLRELMDAIIETTGAQKGFLILAGEDGPRIEVARGSDRKDLPRSEKLVSDSIVQRVLRERKPIIIADALNDTEFNSSMSILDLKLCSVMCVPMVDRGTLIGIIYVGHDNVVNLFDRHNLDTLTIFAAQATLIIQNALLVNSLESTNALLRDELEGKRFGEILGASEGMRGMFRKVEKVAATDISVLVTGETGTGKELVARELHRRSHRAKGPFVTVNCGAIPDNLLESELFGHVKGAFTGAIRDKKGRFQEAVGGTLFLDEIGELSPSLQVKLLRAIQEKTVTPVGSNRPIQVDVRIVAATNRDLEQEIRDGRFREDLYYRLNVVTIHLPPLRDRGDDVILIAKYLLDRYNREFGRNVKGFTTNAVVAMKKYHWPGNIRQLENKLKKAVVMAEKPLLGPEDLDLTPEVLMPIMPLAKAKEEFQRRYINEVLARNNGNRTKTARDLGVDPRTIFRHLEREQRRK